MSNKDRSLFLIDEIATLVKRLREAVEAIEDGPQQAEIVRPEKDEKQIHDSLGTCDGTRCD